MSSSVFCLRGREGGKQARRRKAAAFLPAVLFTFPACCLYFFDWLDLEQCFGPR